MTRIDTKISPDLPKFLLVGGVSFVVNQLALAVLYEYGLGWMSRHAETPFGDLDVALLVASIIAVEISIIARFILNDVWTFRDRRDRPFWERFVQSNLGSFGSPLISLATVNVLTPVFGMSYLLANAIGVTLGFAWNWGWSSRVVWRPRAPEPHVIEVSP